MKNFLKSYFEFSKKEYNGILVLCLLIIVILSIPSIYRLCNQTPFYEFSQFEREIESFRSSAQELKKYDQRVNKDYSAKEISSPLYFEFDPNRLPETQWQKLGLTDKQIRVIKNYESKGGKFYRKEDLQKIYSIGQEQYAKLEPYISIKSALRKEEHETTYRSQEKQKTKNTFALVNINEADSIQLETIRGIGPTFARRIIKYRSRLGGFHNKEQLREIYGLDSARYDQIKDQISVLGTIQKIKINRSTFDELKKYPYLNYNQINAIIQYRNQHGNYKNIYELSKIGILTPENLHKMVPYLDFQ